MKPPISLEDMPFNSMAFIIPPTRSLLVENQQRHKWIAWFNGLYNHQSDTLRHINWNRVEKIKLLPTNITSRIPEVGLKEIRCDFYAAYTTAGGPCFFKNIFLYNSPDNIKLLKTSAGQSPS